MDPSSNYPEPLGEALSHGSQRSAQLVSLSIAAAQAFALYRARREQLNAARDEQSARILQEQERAAYEQTRLGWAPAYDRRWLAQADLIQTARAWAAAASYAGTDETAAAALRRCEDRLRTLHPHAMARYDRLRGEGASPMKAMREAAPLFARDPDVRTGEPAAQHPALEAAVPHRGGPPQADPAETDEQTERTVDPRGLATAADPGEIPVTGQRTAPADTARVDPSAGMAATHLSADRTAVQLAAEGFPYTVADVVRTAALGLIRAAQPQVPVSARRPMRQPGRSM